VTKSSVLGVCFRSLRGIKHRFLLEKLSFPYVQFHNDFFRLRNIYSFLLFVLFVFPTRNQDANERIRGFADSYPTEIALTPPTTPTQRLHQNLRSKKALFLHFLRFIQGLLSSHENFKSIYLLSKNFRGFIEH